MCGTNRNAGCAWRNPTCFSTRKRRRWICMGRAWKSASPCRRIVLDFSCNALQRQTPPPPWRVINAASDMRRHASSSTVQLLSRFRFCRFVFVCLLTAPFGPRAAGAAELVDLHQLDPTIQIELRYAGTNNVLRRPIYPPNMPALLRPEVATRVLEAQ